MVIANKINLNTNLPSFNIDTDTNGAVVYDDPYLHSHNHTNDFHLIRKTEEHPGVNPTVTNTHTK